MVRRVAGTALAGAAVLGVAIMVLGFAGIAPMLRGLRTPPAVLPRALAYAHVLLFALPVVFVSIVASSLLRGAGDTVTPLRMLVITTAFTMVPTPALIHAGLGVASAA